MNRRAIKTLFPLKRAYKELESDDIVSNYKYL